MKSKLELLLEKVFDERNQISYNVRNEETRRKENE